MNILKSLLVVSMLVSGAQVFAHGKNHACGSYFKACKGKGKKECVKTSASKDAESADADTKAKGEACMAEMEKMGGKHHKGMKHDDSAAPAASAAPATTN